jgi:hypothetical protein
MDTRSLAQPAPTTTREQRGLALYRERGDFIEMISSDFYLCPSQNGERFYHVDYRDETCDCPDHVHHGVACKHVYAVGVKLAKRRASRCDGCGCGSPASGLVEVGPEMVAMGDGVLEGQRYCRPCARRHGVL